VEKNMRAMLAKAVLVIAVIAALAATASWAYFIWSFDWGTSYRGRGLWLMAMLFPAGFIFVAALFVVSFPLMLLWELIFREKFPS
jgi:hypothetical protein